MAIPTEFKLTINILACIGVFHFLNDRSKSKCIRYLTFSYCSLRNIIAVINLIQFPVSLLVSQISIIERVIALSYTILTAVNCLYLFHLCTFGTSLSQFFQHWQTYRMARERSKHSAWPFVAFGLIAVCTAIGYYIDSTFISNKIEKMIRLHFNVLVKDDPSIILLTKWYFFVTMGIFETLSTTFITIFYINISHVILKDFYTWNTHLRNYITSSSIKDDDTLIPKYLKLYEDLCENVRLADNFLSKYLGSNLLIMCFHVSFLLYIVITDWNKWGVISVFIAYGLFIVYILIAGSSLINSKVGNQSTCQGQYLSMLLMEVPFMKIMR